MPPWILKAGVTGATSLLPRAELWSSLLHRYVTHSLELTEKKLRTKFGRCRRHLANYARHGGNVKSDLHVMELGTGWFPIAPVGFALCGAGHVWTIDNTSHLQPEQVQATLTMFLQQAHRGGLDGVREDRVTRLERALAGRTDDVDEMLAAVGVERLVCDARTLDLGPSKIDLVVSNNTLEHVPYQVIHDIFLQFRKLLAEGGLMSHWIDMSDHYANFDKSIGIYNFLKFPGPVWRLFNNDLQYQSRLRIPDFRHLHAATGWKILFEENTSGTPEELARIRLAREFQRYKVEDLLVYETWIASRPA